MPRSAVVSFGRPRENRRRPCAALEYQGFLMVPEACPCVRGLGKAPPPATYRTLRSVAFGRMALFYNVSGGFRIKCHGVRSLLSGAHARTVAGRAAHCNTKVFQWFRRRPLACAGCARPRPGHLPHAAVGGFLQKCFVLQRFWKVFKSFCFFLI